VVADDDPGIVEAISLFLREEGYQVEVVMRGNIEAQIVKAQPELLLLDIWMSGVDGGEICRRLKEKRSTQDLPIILVSAHKDIEVISRAVGADDYLPKPFDIELLLDKVEKYVER
jgi:DNA-binding response OmpR family regulator